MNGTYDWKSINDRLTAAIRPASSAVALKFIKTQEELDLLPNLKYWKEQDSTVCKLIGIAAYWNITIALKSKYLTTHCGGNNGLLKREAYFHEGVALSSDPIKWHGRREDAAAHMQAMLADIPSDDHIAVVASPIFSGDILDPDAIIISADPGAAFHLLAALVEKDFQELNFTFRGESSCAETWCRTYTSGKPGLSLGCRGDRCNGALGGHEVRFSISTQDLLKALDGVDRLKSDGIEYPYYPDGVIAINEL